MESEHILKTAEDQLADALHLLETDGKNALETAQQKAKEFGQQSAQMTAISQESRTIADTLDNNATGIADRQKLADDKSIEAYELAKNITDQEKNTNQVIEDLKASVIQTEQKLKKVSEAVRDAHNRSTLAKERALDLLSEVNDLNVPDVNVTKLKEEAESTRVAAVKLINDTNDLINANNELLKQIQEQVLGARQLLEDGYEQNNYLEAIMDDVKLRKLQVEKAVELGDNTLSQAKNTYETLSRKYE